MQCPFFSNRLPLPTFISLLVFLFFCLAHAFEGGALTCDMVEAEGSFGEAR
jgi:hypothetical protein